MANKAKKEAMKVAPKCPACRVEFDTDEQITTEALAQFKKTFLCETHGEAWEAAGEVAPVATMTDKATAEPEAIVTTKEEPTMATTMNAQPKKAASKKTASKISTKKLAPAAKKAAAKVKSKIAAKTVSASTKKSPAKKAAALKVAPVSGGKRGVTSDRVAKVAALANDLFTKQEQVKFTDLRPLVKKEELHDKLLRRVMRQAARAGLLRKAGQGTYARA